MIIGQKVSEISGSKAFIFEKDGEYYKKIDEFTLVNNPVIISDEKTNGWNDIIMSASVDGEDAFFSKLQYDGESYPLNPSVESAVEVGTKVTGTAIISDEIVFGYGLELE